MSRREPAPELLTRLFGSDWENWRFNGLAPHRVDDASEPARRTLAVPARHVLATPLWIEGADPALAPEAAKLELEVRGLLPRAQGMDGVALRLLPVEGRTLAVAAVFPPELPEDCPPAERFEGSPFLLELPPDAVTLWREGEDYVAAFTRGPEVVYWETIDRSAGADEVRGWLSLILQRLRGEGVITVAPRVTSRVEGLPAGRIAPPGCEVIPSPPEEVPSLANQRSAWKPVSLHAAETRQRQRAKMRNVVLAIVAGYIALAAVLLLYAGFQQWRTGRLAAANDRLRAEVAAFQPTRRDWQVLAPTIEPAQFPLELLRGVVESLPPGNIHLTRLVVEEGRIIVEGEADSFALATDYYNALAGNEALRGITWSGNTNPIIGATVTTFHAEGALPPP